MNRLHVMLGVLIVLFSIPSAMAITVDGQRGAGEWDENWAFGQVEGTGYSAAGPFGDKMVIFQNGSWYDEDPAADAGGNFDENLSTVGPYMSGYDLKAVYARYDPVNDILYGLCTVYGLPGDLDGDGDPASDPQRSDTLGASTPNDVNGIGPTEFFNIRLIQGTKTARIGIDNNDWDVTDLGTTPTSLTNADVIAANSFVGGVSCTNCVYEIQISNIADSFDVSPGQSLIVRVTAGAEDDQIPGGGLVGEDIAELYITIPNPEIDIEKTTNGFDADNPTGPGLEKGDAVVWTYVVTNTGDVPLENVVVTDDELGTISNIISKSINSDDVLEVGEVWIYETTGTAECGQYENIAVVNADWLGIPVTDNDPSHYFVNCEPDIDIEKHTNGFDADYAPGPKIDVGETIEWEYFVTNTGNVPLSNIVVEDNILGVIGDSMIVSKSINNDNVLDIGETWTYVVADTLEECIPQYENIADVTGEDESGTVVMDEDPSHFHCQPVVPVLTPVGILAMVGILGALGIITLRRRD